MAIPPPAEPVVFSTAYEALIRTLGAKLDEAAHQRFLAHGVNLRQPLKAAYPYATWIESLRVAAKVIAPDRPEEEATYVLGYRLMESFTETLVGKALMGVLRVIGLRRGMERMRRSLRTSNNYTETRVTEPAPGVFHLWVSLVTFPSYYLGLFKAGFTALGHPETRVELLGREQGGATFLISWAVPSGASSSP